MEEVERLTEAGADRAIAEELESVVALFSDVLRGYQIPAAEIDAHEEAIRRGGYAALLRDRAEGEQPVVICGPRRDCFERRTFTVPAGSPVTAGPPRPPFFPRPAGACAPRRTFTARAGPPVTAGPLSQLFLDENIDIKVLEVIRDGEAVSDPPEDFVTRPGDELTLEGSTEAFT